MSLRGRLVLVPETVQEFDLAASEKFASGQALAVGGDTGAAIYLLGYCAEMLLKNAYFRLTGATLSDEVGPRLGPAKTRASQLIPGISHEAYHSLRFWAMLVQEERRAQGYAWAASFEQEFEVRTERLYNNWWVEMRYRRDCSGPADVAQALDDAGWLSNNSVVLWQP